jgi:UPF0271 protein
MAVSGATIDLNADLGEGCPWDEALLDRVTSAAIACGAHAGDEATARRALRLALARGVVVGAHPGYADREHFGRREMDLPPLAVRDLVLTQCEWLGLLAGEEGVTIRHVKPHGALYNQAQGDPRIAAEVVNAVKILGVALVGQPGGAIETEARREGVPFWAEGFPERGYRPDGRLVPRGEPGAVLDDPDAVAAQALALVRRGVDTLCVHGDNPQATALADLLRRTLEGAGVRLRPVVLEAAR